MQINAENENLLHKYEHSVNCDKYFDNPDTKYYVEDEEDSDKKEKAVRKWPTIFTAILVGIGWLLNEIALAWVHERVPDDYHPLPDLFFSYFPEIRGAIRITEYIMLILLASALIVMFTHHYKWIVLRRAFFCIALSYTFRAICVVIFQVPVPSTNTYCAPKMNSSVEVVIGRVTKMFWSAGIEQLRPRELCGDLIVSGHTLTIFSAFLVFKTYAPKRIQFLSYIYHVLAFIALFSILLARKHYMIDVVLGYTVSTRVFMEYHSLAVSYHNKTFDTNALAWSWWSSLIPFLERDAPSNFHNHMHLYRSKTSVSRKSRRTFE
uniref:PAP2_C domain-containing protein n=1 Tax=Caenorhabditis japonica TaxID=281687 RepID=A0A8R1DRA2_CAEJA